MGDAQRQARTVRRFSTIVTAVVCRMVPAEVCEAILGDMDERGAGRVAAIAALLSFLGRSQWAAWRSWRPWLALAGALPIGLLLHTAVSRIATVQAVYLWMYANNWTWTYLRPEWMWSELAPTAAGMMLAWAQVAGIAWASGFLLARWARRIAWVQATVLVVCLMYGGAQALLPALHSPGAAHAMPQLNAPVFALRFYREVLPHLAQLLFVVLPVLHGMRAQLKLDVRPMRSATEA